MPQCKIVKHTVVSSPSEINEELCELMIWYKVPMVGINGKLNETKEVSALWSNILGSCVLFSKMQFG